MHNKLLPMQDKRSHNFHRKLENLNSVARFQKRFGFYMPQTLKIAVDLLFGFFSFFFQLFFYIS